MSDINGNYNGDRSGVLPSNTAAMLHFSDQFAQLAQQRRQQQAMQQREDENRKIALQKYLGTSLDNKEFNTQTDAQGVINQGLQDLNNNAVLMLKKGAPVSDVMGYINEGLTGTLQKARAITDINKGIIAGAATIKAHNPELDTEALIDATAKNLYYQTDKDGSHVLRQDYSNIDPTQAGKTVLEVYKKNPELFYPAGSADKALQGFFDKQKLIPVNEEPGYNNATGDRTSPGFKGELPHIVDYQKDDKGKAVYDEKGKPKIDITGSSYYRIPGQEQDYINNQGQKVKVVPTETYNQLPDPVKAQIEKEVKDQTAQAGVEPDSEYANMLRGNLAYNKLLGLANNTYKFNTPKDESFDRKKALFSQGIQQAHLEISKRNANRSEQEFQYRKNKDQQAMTDANGKPIESKFDKVIQDNQQIYPDPFSGEITKFIDVTNMDRDEYNQLTGSKVKTVTDKEGKTTTVYGAGVAPFETQGKKFYILNENTGNLEGKDGIITKEAADARQIEAIPKTKLKTGFQKAKDAVKNTFSKWSKFKR